MSEAIVKILRACHYCKHVSTEMVNCPHCGMPMTEPQDGNAYVQLGKPSLDAIRQIVKDEVHKALCLDKDDEDDSRDWTVRQVMYAYGMSQHDAEVFMQQREVQDDEERVEPYIATVQGKQFERIYKLERLLQSCIDFIGKPVVVGSEHTEAYARALCREGLKLLHGEEQGKGLDFGAAMHKLTTDAGTSAQDLEEIGRKIVLMAAQPPPSLTVTCTHMERKYRGMVYLVEEAKDE